LANLNCSATAKEPSVEFFVTGQLKYWYLSNLVRESFHWRGRQLNFNRLHGVTN